MPGLTEPLFKALSGVFFVQGDTLHQQKAGSAECDFDKGMFVLFFVEKQRLDSLKESRVNRPPFQAYLLFFCKNAITAVVISCASFGASGEPNILFKPLWDKFLT